MTMSKSLPGLCLHFSIRKILDGRYYWLISSGGKLRDIISMESWAQKPKTEKSMCARLHMGTRLPGAPAHHWFCVWKWRPSLSAHAVGLWLPPAAGRCDWVRNGAPLNHCIIQRLPGDSWHLWLIVDQAVCAAPGTQLSLLGKDWWGLPSSCWVYWLVTLGRWVGGHQWHCLKDGHISNMGAGG